MTDRSNILVTGRAGYIGSHACKALKEAGFNPITFDNPFTGWVCEEITDAWRWHQNGHYDAKK